MIKNNDWIDINVKRPPEYELRELLTSDNKIRVGWRSGLHYEGVRVRPTDNIIMWRNRTSGEMMIYS